jgi:cytidylate kinase
MINIAIDGPSGAGKSTVAKMISRKLNILYLDTGAMYRAVGLKALRNNVDISSETEVKTMLDDTNVEIRYENGVQKIFLDKENVDGFIREHAVSKAASDISAIPCVRLKMVELQREIAFKNDCVLDGRDIGSFVLPNAFPKVFLTASPQERAKRRQLQLAEKGENISFEKILADIRERDANDENRAFAPLVKARDAVLIDSSDLTAEQVCEKIIGLMKSR